MDVVGRMRELGAIISCISDAVDGINAQSFLCVQLGEWQQHVAKPEGAMINNGMRIMRGIEKKGVQVV
jgi:hypothetical protein